MSGNLISAAIANAGPKVVGTILTQKYLETLRPPEASLPCDLVELRVDGFQDYDRWPESGKAIETAGLPVMMTLRLAKEGGYWKRSDRERLAFFERAVEAVSGVDIELQSEIAKEVCSLAAEAGKTSIVSYHNFDQTPPVSELTKIIEKGRAIGSIVKIAAKVNSLDDVETLRCILQGRWNVPLCVIGMGPLGKETRLRFPLEGSCFTYGYLDVPGAPGQFSAEELKKYIRSVANP